MHQRMKPVGHRFRYRVYSLLIDLDRLDEADRLSPLFSVNRANVASFHEADHLRGAKQLSLRAHVDALLTDAGLDRPAARIELACYPRIFGQVFNPLSVYYAYDEAGELLALVYEVRNTFGENHTYVCKLEPGDMTPAGIRQSRSKLFYVSPFIEMQARYNFRMNIPGEQIRWRILETDRSGPLLAATYRWPETGPDNTVNFGLPLADSTADVEDLSVASTTRRSNCGSRGCVMCRARRHLPQRVIVTGKSSKVRRQGRDE